MTSIQESHHHMESKIPRDDEFPFQESPPKNPEDLPHQFQSEYLI